MDTCATIVVVRIGRASRTQTYDRAADGGRRVSSASARPSAQDAESANMNGERVHERRNQAH